MPLNLPYPVPEDFAIQETELAPGRLLGTFQTFPPEAFMNDTTVRTFQIPFVSDQTVSRDDATALGYLGPLISDILGYATYDTEGDPPGGFLRFLPYVDFHERHMVAARVDISTAAYAGLDTETDPDELPHMHSANLYKWLIAQVHFAAPKFKLGDYDFLQGLDSPTQLGATPAYESQRFVFAQVHRGIQYATLRPGTLQFVGLSGANADVLFDVPQVVRFEDIIATWMGIPERAIPYKALDNCMGKVNRDSLIMETVPRIVNGDTFGPESLTLHTYNVIPGNFPNGDPCGHVQMVFKHKPDVIYVDGSETPTDTYGWNGLIQPGTATYRRVKKKGSTSDDPTDPGYIGLFQLADFDLLFEPEPA